MAQAQLKNGTVIEVTDGVYYIIAGRGKSRLVNRLDSFTVEYQSAVFAELGFICEYFARCENPATHVISHPIFHNVPVCNRCAALAAR